MRRDPLFDIRANDIGWQLERVYSNCIITIRCYFRKSIVPFFMVKWTNAWLKSNSSISFFFLLFFFFFLSYFNSSFYFRTSNETYSINRKSTKSSKEFDRSLRQWRFRVPLRWGHFGFRVISSTTLKIRHQIVCGFRCFILDRSKLRSQDTFYRGRHYIILNFVTGSR